MPKIVELGRAHWTDARRTIKSNRSCASIQEQLGLLDLLLRDGVIVDGQGCWPHVAPSPLAGKSLRGWPDLSLSRGEVIWRDGQIVCDRGRGQFIAQRKDPY